MKSVKIIAMIFCACVCLNIHAANHLNVTSYTLPGAMSSYLKISDTPVSFNITDPDADGDVTVEITMVFEVIKHNPNIGYFELKADILSFTNKTLLSFDADYTENPGLKPTHNPAVGEKLANAIKNNSIKYVNVTFFKSCSLEESIRLKKEASSVAFTRTRLK